MATAATDIDE